MINDILEQVAEDFLRERGYFTQHNIKYKPKKIGPAYSVNSDIDILGIHPRKRGLEKVAVVSCKSWQAGLNIERDLRGLEYNPEKIVSGKSLKKIWQEFFDTHWTSALRERVGELTNQTDFIFYLAVVKCRGDKKAWENFKLFTKNFPNCKIEIIDLKTMIFEIQNSLTTTPSHSELTRLLQLIRADNGKIEYGN